MPTVDITLTAEPFDVNPAWTVEEFHQALIASITGATSTLNVLLGQVGGGTPGLDVGPWLDNGTWKYHNGSAYRPTILQVGQGAFQVTLSGNPSANRSAVFPDKSGTVAYTSDVFVGRGTQTPVQHTDPTPTLIEWDKGDSFSISLTQNVLIQQDDSQPGQTIYIGIFQPPAGTHTVDWLPDVIWQAGGVPDAPDATKGHLIRLHNSGGTIYGTWEIENAS